MQKEKKEVFCQLQIRPKQGWARDRQRRVWTSTHSHSPCSVWTTEILRSTKRKEGIHRALSGISFWLPLGYGTCCSTYPAPAAPAAEQRWHGRLSPASSSKDLLGTEAGGMEKPLPALQKAVRSGVSSDEYFLVYNLLNSVKRTSAFLGEYLHLARWIFAICLWQRPQ